MESGMQVQVASFLEMCKRVAVAAAMVVGLLVATPAASQDPIQQKVRDSLVYIEMKGKAANGDDRVSAGTGFFVSEDGFILTTYNNYERISDVSSDTLEIGVSLFERKSPAEKIARIIHSDRDFLLLKVPRGQKNYNVMRLGSSKDILNNQVFLSGFRITENPFSVDYRNIIDQVTGDSSDGYTLVLKQSIDPGLRGSAVYTGDGTIVGVYKGPSSQGESLFIPLQYAMPMFLKIGVNVQEPVNKWIKSAAGQKALQEWFAQLMKAEVDEEIQSRVNTYIQRRVDNYMQHVVAYSYSASFELSSERNTYTMRFFKTDEDEGEILCAAKGSNLIKNNIFAVFNDKQDAKGRGVREYFRESDRTFTRSLLAQRNEDLYDHDPPGGRTKISPNMKIRFTVDQDEDKLKEPLLVECTITIIGPAKAPVGMISR